MRKAAAGAAAIVICACLCAAAGILICSGEGRVTAYAATNQEEIQNSREKIEENQKKIEELNSQKNDIDKKLEELSQLKADAAEYIAKLDTELSAVEEEITGLQEEMTALEEEIAVTEEELEAAKEDEARQYSMMKLRIKYMYERGSQGLINTLFNSGNFADLINKTEYVTNVSDYDRNKLDEYVETKHAKEAKEEELNSEHEVLEETEAKLMEQKENIEKLQSDKASEIAGYNSKIAAAEADIDAMSDDIAGIKQAIQAEENNIAAIEAKIKAEEEAARKSAEENGGVYETKTVGDIVFTWPCPSSSRVTSQFGDRESPTEGASTNHKGIDIGASSGASVLAAASGTVVISTYSASAGNYVMLSHGGGVYTVYMHMASVGVSSGDEVSMGQTIGTVGSTGYSTGPHLHFGLRISGSYVNPLSYVSP